MGVVECASIHARRLAVGELKSFSSERAEPNFGNRIGLELQPERKNGTAERLQVGILRGRRNLHDDPILQVRTEQALAAALDWPPEVWLQRTACDPGVSSTREDPAGSILAQL